MKIVIPGGSGHLGVILARAFTAEGHEVVVLSRGTKTAPWRTVAWDGETLGPWCRELDGADAVVNLAGRSVNCRYHASNRRQMLDSRIRSTEVIGRAIAAAARPPRIWLQSSTATIYAHRYDTANDEATGILGGGEPNAPDTWRFSIDVARQWEAKAVEVTPASTRLVLMRTAMVMSPERGGTFDILAGLASRGLGGSVGDGRQFVSWIHDADFLRAVAWLLEHDLSGPVNLSSPNPLPYAEFMRGLRRAMRMPIGLPATKWMIEIAALLMRTESELVLKSRRVVPGRLLEAGFRFEFPEWPGAAADLVRRRRAVRAA
jgi:uncharacterized protein (TIGR01777 family)